MAHIPEDARYVNPPDEREDEREEEITARAEDWLKKWVEGEGYTACLCNRLVNGRDFASHAETCRELRREVE